MEDLRYTPEELDALALEGCESLVFHPGKVATYDVEAYRRVIHQPVETGAYPLFDEKTGSAPFSGAPKTGSDPVSACSVEGRYLLRMGGFRRQTIFGPAEAADMIAGAGVNYADSLGDNMLEHLVLCRRTGVMPIFEAPTMGMALPFLASELAAFEQTYRRHITEFADWIRRLEGVYGHPLLDREGHPWILYLRATPLQLFELSAQRKPHETAAELETHCGRPRFSIDGRAPRDRAAQAKAWTFIRRRHMEVLQLMGRVFREIAAPRGVFVGNAHTLPAMDYELIGEVFEYPGVAARSGYIEEPALREPYMGYSVRLLSDLTGRAPVMSVRVNTLVSGTRIIPGPNTIRRWFDTSVRHGASGFYFWVTDYPSAEGQYFGSLPGNPDPSTHGRERWDAMLDCFRDIAPARRFAPPDGEIGILVPYDVLDTEGWRRVLGTFTELETARTWSKLVSARSVERDRGCLDAIRLFAVPSLPFASDALCDAIEGFVNRGGVLVVGDRQLARFDMGGDERRPPAGLGAELDGVSAMDHSVGEGRVVVFEEPGLGLSIEATDVASSLAEAATRWERLLDGIRLDRKSWIYDVSARNLLKLTGNAPAEDPPPVEPNLEPQAYMFEHSSQVIIPFIENPTEAPGE